MSNLQRSQPALVLGAAIGGLLLTPIPGVASRAGALVVPALVVLLTAVFLHVDPSGIRKAGRHTRVAASSLVVNFAWTPLLAAGLGAVLLGGEPELRVGLLMLLITPCTDWYLVFTALARGNLSLASVLLPVNLALQLIGLPVYLFLLAGALVPLRLPLLAGSLAVVVVVPALVAATVRTLAVGARDAAWFEERILNRTPGVQLTFLCVAVAAMFASEGGLIVERPGAVARLLVPLLAFFVVNFLLAQLLARLLRLRYPERVTLTFTTLARNSPLALAIAAAAFPDRPLIALTLILAPLLELPVLSAAGRLLLRAEPPSTAPGGGRPAPKGHGPV